MNGVNLADKDGTPGIHLYFYAQSTLRKDFAAIAQGSSKTRNDENYCVILVLFHVF